MTLFPVCTCNKCAALIFFFKWQAPFQQYFLSTSTSGRPLQHQLCYNWINPDAFICCLMLQLDKLFASRCTNGALSRGSAMGLVRKTAFFFFAENSQDQSSVFDHQLSFSGPALHDDPSAAFSRVSHTGKKKCFLPPKPGSTEELEWSAAVLLYLKVL